MGRFIVAALAIACAGTDASAAENPWAALTRMDVIDIHDTLRDNHPGPADPTNPHYRDWLAKGFGPALARAAAARSLDDYLRTLEFYANGFSDYHIEVYPMVTEWVLTWPGFIVTATPADGVSVAYAEADSGAKAGDKLISCDGKSVDALLKERTDPYFWNIAIPHARYQQAYRLFYQAYGDKQPKSENCVFSSGTVSLKWRLIKDVAFKPMLDNARGVGERKLNIQKIGSVWLISIPTFNFNTEEDIGKAQAFIAELNNKAPELRKGPIVFDVRGNGGGASSYAEDVVKAIWGKDWDEYLVSQFDDTVDWRASPKNLAALEENVKRSTAQGHADAVDYYSKAAEAMKVALAKKQPFARSDAPNKPLPIPAADPVTGKAYLFTDVGCASSCLIFADMLLRIPNVVQIGFPTYADTNYTDNTQEDLPSGLAYLSYSLKVYQHRPRKNNEWYEPKIPWPGGPVNDQAIAKWVELLR